MVYHYWNVHAHRNEVSVLEVFDDDAARRTPPLLQAVALTALGLNRKPPMSSLAPPAVRVMGQSYFFSMGVKTMAVTSTQRGITSKNVLLGTSTDQVCVCVCVFVCVCVWLGGGVLCTCTLLCCWAPLPTRVRVCVCVWLGGGVLCTCTCTRFACVCMLALPLGVFPVLSNTAEGERWTTRPTWG